MVNLDFDKFCKNKDRLPIINGYQFVDEDGGEYFFQKIEKRHDGFCRQIILHREDIDDKKGLKNFRMMLENEWSR